MGRTYRKNGPKKSDEMSEDKAKTSHTKKKSFIDYGSDEDAIYDSIELAEEIASDMKYSFETDPDVFLAPSDLVNFRLVGSISLIDGDGFVVEDDVLVDFWVDNEELAEKVMENVDSLGRFK